MLRRTSINTSETVYSALTSWQYLLAELIIPCGSEFLSLEPLKKAPSVTTDGSWIEIHGKAKTGTFTLYIPADLCLKIIEASCPNVNVEVLAGAKAAMLVEHLLTPEIQRLESLLNEDLQFTDAGDVQTPPRQQLLGLRVSDSVTNWEIAFSLTGKLFEAFERVVSEKADPDAFKLDRKMFVHLGPVVLPARDALSVSKGANIDFGVVPSDVIRGFLVRSDNYYWPVYIEDELVQISGELGGPINPENASSDQVFVTFGIGEVELSAIERSKLVPGSQVSVSRYPNSVADIYFQAVPYGSGQLKLIGENLGITVESTGAAVNREARENQAQMKGVA